jgi:hypothetical protein
MLHAASKLLSDLTCAGPRPEDHLVQGSNLKSPRCQRQMSSVRVPNSDTNEVLNDSRYPGFRVQCLIHSPETDCLLLPPMALVLGTTSLPSVLSLQ